MLFFFLLKAEFATREITENFNCETYSNDNCKPHNLYRLMFTLAKVWCYCANVWHKIKNMKITNTIVWACGALAVIFTCCIYFGLFTSEKSVMKINIGTYGDHIYRYALDTETMEFTLLEKAEAHNASYVIQCGSHIAYQLYLPVAWMH